MRAQPLVDDAAVPGGAAGRARAHDGLEVAFDVGPGEIRTRIRTIACSTGVIETRRGRGLALPYEDESFGRVDCPRGLQLLSDRGRALGEMRRVLVPGGEVRVRVRGSIDGSATFALLVDSLERHAGSRGAAVVRWQFCMPEPDDLRGYLAASAFEQVRVVVVRTTERFSSIGAFLSHVVPVRRIVSDVAKRDVLADLERALGPWVDRNGLLVTSETIVGRARRAERPAG